MDNPCVIGNWFTQLWSWKFPRSEVRKLENRELMVLSSSPSLRPTPKAGRRMTFQLKDRQEKKNMQIVPINLFDLFMFSRDLVKSTLIEEAICLTHSTNSILISSRNTNRNTLKIVFNQMSGYPMVQSSWHIKLASQWELVESTCQFGKNEHFYYLESFKP